MTTGDQTKQTDRELLNYGDGPINSILILGEPGSGKSTLTRKLFRESCSSLYHLPHVFPLPVHLELRSVPWHETKESGKTLAEWILSKVSSEVDSVKGVHSDGFLFKAFSISQGLVVFFDGLDEVPSDHVHTAYTAVIEAIKELGGMGGSTSVIVTGRSQLTTSLPRSFLAGFNHIVTVEPLSQADVFQFLQRWPFLSHGAAEAARIFRSIQSNPSLQEMCTNPLVLSMYVARDQLYVSRAGIRPTRLPDTRTEFYQEVVNELLLFRRGDQENAAIVGSQLRHKREDALGKVAIEHLLDKEQPANSIPWTLIVFKIKSSFGLSDFDSAEREVRKLAIETGIFSEERRAETVRFLHLTLCEFLAAIELRESHHRELMRIAGLVSKAKVQGGRADLSKYWYLRHLSLVVQPGLN